MFITLSLNIKTSLLYYFAYFYTFKKNNKMLKSKNNINTGALIQAHIHKNKITKSDLGAAIGRNGLAILQYIRNESIQTGILLDICYALKHNFFKDIASKLPDDFTTTNPTDKSLMSEKDQLIAQLQEENKVLKIQNELLMLIKK
jgi:DNA-binding Xre family transcriptional regulator